MIVKNTSISYHSPVLSIGWGRKPLQNLDILQLVRSNERDTLKNILSKSPRHLSGNTEEEESYLFDTGGEFWQSSFNQAPLGFTNVSQR